MSNTPKLKIQELANSANQNLVVNSSAFSILDVLVDKTVKSRGVNTPPGSPADGDAYIVGSSPTGLWSGKSAQIAYWRTSAGVWQFIVPLEGWAVRVQDDDDANGAPKEYIYTGSAWTLPDLTGGATGMTISSKSAAYTLVLADANTGILHPSADTTARTFTIPANASVAFPVGTMISFFNQNAAGVVTIAITTDTMRLAGAGTTGSRTLAANGVATAIKLTSTEWMISGVNLT